MLCNQQVYKDTEKRKLCKRKCNKSTIEYTIEKLIIKKKSTDVDKGCSKSKALYLFGEKR